MADLRQRWRKSLTAIHIAVSVSVIGADLAIISLGIAGLAGDPRAVYPAAQLIGARVVWPLAVGALATGVALALLTPYGLLRYWWVATKLGITAALSALVLFVLVPGLGTAADAATAGEALSDGRRLLLVLAPAGSSALLLTNVALAVFKPGGRIRTHDGVLPHGAGERA